MDSGPLVALSRRADPDHEACLNVLGGLAGPMLTTWVAFGEAMHLVGGLAERHFGRARKWRAQAALWSLVDLQALAIAEPTLHTLARVRQLMEQYRDTPMDLADATLVALAEDRRQDRIFTLDSDFEIYRLPGNRRFRIVPEIP